MDFRELCSRRSYKYDTLAENKNAGVFMVDCKSWSDCGVLNGGCCAKAFFGSKPSQGICLRVCKEREARSVETIEKSRTIPTVKQLGTFVLAVATGKYVTLEIVQERKAICASCEFQMSDNGVAWCGICGCKVSGESKKIDNLAAYEENLPLWGCKHKLRAQEMGWKR
jgi:hypothetical protein